MTNATTKSIFAQRGYVPGTSRSPRSARTLALQMAQAEAERQREIGARIKDLRGRIPQPVIADRVGVTLRAYQAWEAGGGIAWDNLVKLAEVFGVSEDFIEYGLGGDYKPGTNAARLEQKVDALLVHFGIDPAQFDGSTLEDTVARAAAGSIAELEVSPSGRPRAKPAPVRKRRAS